MLETGVLKVGVGGNPTNLAGMSVNLEKHIGCFIGAWVCKALELYLIILEGFCLSEEGM